MKAAAIFQVPRPMIHWRSTETNASANSPHALARGDSSKIQSISSPNSARNRGGCNQSNPE